MNDLDEGHLSLSYDGQRNLVRIVGRGRWTLVQFEQHISLLRAIVRKARREHGYIRLLVDFREAATQTGDVVRRMTAAGETLYKPFDRLAILVVSELVKLQVQNTERRATTEIFLNPEPAERWLLAHDTARSGPSLELEWG